MPSGVRKKPLLVVVVLLLLMLLLMHVKWAVCVCVRAHLSGV